jgi:hypothetical protein
VSSGLANVRREALLLLGSVAVIAILLLAFLLRPAVQPLCTFTGGLGSDPVPRGYEHCFESRQP